MMRGHSNTMGFDFTPSFGDGFMDDDYGNDEYFGYGDHHRYTDTHSHALAIPSHGSSSRPRHRGSRSDALNARLNSMSIGDISVGGSGNNKSSKLNETHHHIKKTQEEPELSPSIDHTTVSPAPEWALCSICQEIFKKPTITRCGHTFCHGCIMEVINRKGGCPLCRQKIDGPSDLNMNYQMKQVIGGIVVRCKYGMKPLRPTPSSSSFPPSLSLSMPASSSSSSSNSQSPSQEDPSSSSTPAISIPHEHLSSSYQFSSSYPISSYFTESIMWCVDNNGCPETFEYGDKDKHETQCEHAPVDCFNEGCPLKVKKRDIETHMHECPHRVLKCVLCGDMIQSQHQEKHGLICPEKTIQCTHMCGSTFFRRQRTEHLAACPNVEAACPHASFGCKFVAKRELHDEHLRVCVYESLKDYLSQTQQQIKQLVELTHTQQKEIKTLKTTIATQATEIASLKTAATHTQSQRTRTTLRSFLNNPFDDLLHSNAN